LCISHRSKDTILDFINPLFEHVYEGAYREPLVPQPNARVRAQGEGSCFSSPCAGGPTGNEAYGTFCAYHSSFGTPASPVIHGNETYGEPSVCSAALTSPKNFPAADTLMSYTTHKITEAMTNPFGDAWWDNATGGRSATSATPTIRSCMATIHGSSSAAFTRRISFGMAMSTRCRPSGTNMPTRAFRLDHERLAGNTAPAGFVRLTG